jgi:hypothetical protein
LNQKGPASFAPSTSLSLPNVMSTLVAPFWKRRVSPRNPSSPCNYQKLTQLARLVSYTAQYLLYGRIQTT